MGESVDCFAVGDDSYSHPCAHSDVDKGLFDSVLAKFVFGVGCGVDVGVDNCQRSRKGRGQFIEDVDVAPQLLRRGRDSAVVGCLPVQTQRAKGSNPNEGHLFLLRVN